MKAVGEAALVALRRDVRRFLEAELQARSFEPSCDAWLEGHDPAFSRKLGKRGWLGMTWPPQYGGHGRSPIERFVVTEELLAAGAPVAAHWIADRQTGPLLLRYGSDEQRRRYLPRIAQGKFYVAIGMSEPESGSDLASIRSLGTKVRGGWVVNGTKVWTSHAHRSDVMVALIRTSGSSDDRHAGLSQVIIPMDSDGLTVTPIEVMTGEAHFSEVSLTDVFVADSQVLGRIGEGWRQVTSELAHERSGPERFMSTYPLFEALTCEADKSSNANLGELTSQLWALHLLSERVNRLVGSGSMSAAEPALVKDAGTQLESEIIEVARKAMGSIESPSAQLVRLYQQACLAAPAFSLRGGTTEILRTIIAKSWEPVRV